MLRSKIRLPRPIRIILIVLAIILGTMAIIKATSQEDCWIRNSKGKWIKHGNPSSPKPSEMNKRN